MAEITKKKTLAAEEVRISPGASGLWWFSPLNAMLMDAIQRCLMFEDRDETARQGRAVAKWFRISPGASGT